MTMQAARFRWADQSFGIETVPIPIPSSTEVLVRVKSAGVCLSDVHIIEGAISSPEGFPNESVTLGHEVSGVVESIGDAVTGPPVGSRVLINPLRPTSTGMTTMGVDYDGGWAEYVVVPAELVIPIDEELSFDQAAIIPDAVSTPWASITSTADVRPAESVGIWGVGGLGTHAVQLARLIGAAPIIAIDPLPAARERAMAAGADLALAPEDPQLADQIRRVTSGRGLDVAFDNVGADAVRQQAIPLLGDHGRLVMVGVDAADIRTNSTLVVVLSKSLRGHYGSMPHHLHEILALTRHGRLDLASSISAIYPLSEVQAAVSHLSSKVEDPVRVILHP